jgi:hypothetical protein
VDRFGLVHGGMTGLYLFQQRLVHKRTKLDGMAHADLDHVSFLEDDQGRETHHPYRHLRPDAPLHGGNLS